MPVLHNHKSVTIVVATAVAGRTEVSDVVRVEDARAVPGSGQVDEVAWAEVAETRIVPSKDDGDETA